MNTGLVTFLLSMTPVGELRAAIPFGVASGLSPGVAFVLAVVGNALVAPVVFLFLEFIHFRFMHLRNYRSMFDFFMERTRLKAKPKIEKYGYWGLFILVAIPLPLTGVYTASLAAWFFGMRKWPAFLAMCSGLIVAAAIMLSISVGAAAVF